MGVPCHAPGSLPVFMPQHPDAAGRFGKERSRFSEHSVLQFSATYPILTKCQFSCMVRTCNSLLFQEMNP